MTEFPVNPHTVRLGVGLGPHWRAIVDLSPPDDREHERFETDLADLLELLFERWCPARADDPPLAGATTLAGTLARGWTEVWFPPGDRPASVQPVLNHPWVRLEGGYWPFDFVDSSGALIEVTTYPPDDERRSERPCWIRSVHGGAQLVELRLRPDRGRAGRVHIEVQINTDLFDFGPAARTDSEDTARRHAEHALLALGQWEDLLALHTPVFAEVSTPGSAPMRAAGPGGWPLELDDEILDRVCGRILARIDAALAMPPWPRQTRLLGLYGRWVSDLRDRARHLPSWVNAQDALDRSAVSDGPTTRSIDGT